MSAQRTAPGRLTLIRDVTSYPLGWLLILKQAGILFDPPAEVSIPLAVIGGLLVGVPGLAQVLPWLAQALAGIGTGGSGSSPAAPASSLPSPPPSPEQSGDS